ncbi:Aste57867_21488 [Aphanomyces stellatus]|uniref:Aste57867_21488 protein n=1 Tax=Aphanomyces stellatus TaxID=120398 RepID=A0A485LJR0_9STRA|nr:hypothetical protein As57867_021419 [Aphanomyces stellatus]VFT98158.1 Aste57867_21488 [Aphanomyces stellatus]
MVGLAWHRLPLLLLLTTAATATDESYLPHFHYYDQQSSSGGSGGGWTTNADIWVTIAFVELCLLICVAIYCQNLGYIRTCGRRSDDIGDAYVHVDIQSGKLVAA